MDKGISFINHGKGKICKFGDECRFIHQRLDTIGNDLPRGDIKKCTANPNGIPSIPQNRIATQSNQSYQQPSQNYQQPHKQSY